MDNACPWKRTSFRKLLAARRLNGRALESGLHRYQGFRRITLRFCRWQQNGREGKLRSSNKFLIAGPVATRRALPDRKQSPRHRPDRGCFRRRHQAGNRRASAAVCSTTARSTTESDPAPITNSFKTAGISRESLDEARPPDRSSRSSTVIWQASSVATTCPSRLRKRSMHAFARRCGSASVAADRTLHIASPR